MEDYYNTTNLPDTTKEARDSRTQNMEIIAFFNNNPGHWTPWEVMDGTSITCINSVRRSMTNLTDKGRLIKTKDKKMGGPFDKLAYCWTVELRLFT